MRICIPTGSDKGLDSYLYDHFGSAPYFALADTESGEVEVVRNSGQHHGREQCEPASHIDVSKTDAVVCQGMGKRALMSLERAGLDVMTTTSYTVRDVIAEVRAGQLRKLTVEQACGGHGHGHGPAHGCGDGRGHRHGG